MPHPDIDNDTPLVLEPLFMLDEDGRPALSVVVKATFAIETHGLALLAEQPGLVCGGELWFPDAAISSYRREPEVTPIKLATDVAVIAHAWAPAVGTRVLEVGLRLGPVARTAWVLGDRAWIDRRWGDPVLTPPARFERIPLCYERAFGGVDDRGNPGRPDIDRRNPVGRGHRRGEARPVDGDLAPNIEDPAAPIRSYHDRPAPVGFGFVSPDWLPRAALAGTYDAAWDAERKPLLPRDFDPRFYNAASPGLTAPGYLRGDEPVELFNLTPEGYLTFELPGLPPPSLRVSLIGRSDGAPPLVLDTVILDLDAREVSLIWRARIGLDGGPHDLHALELRSPAARVFPRTHVEQRIDVAANISPPGAYLP
jgi:hypothetical protein